MKRVLLKSEFKRIVQTKVRVRITNTRTHYHTIDPCGRCWYSTFFSSLAITSNNYRDASYCIRMRLDQMRRNEFFVYMDEFEQSEGFQLMESSRDQKDNRKYIGMKLQTPQNIEESGSLVAQLWGGTHMVRYHPLWLKAASLVRAGTPEPSEESGLQTPPLQNKAFVLFQKEPVGEQVFNLEYFIGGDNLGISAFNFPFKHMWRWLTDNLKFPHEEQKLKTHCFAFGNAHFFNVSTEISDDFLKDNGNGALFLYIDYVMAFLANQPTSWSEFGQRNSREGAERDLTIMTMFFRESNWVSEEKLNMLEALNASEAGSGPV